jgi:dTDP-4-dehydrorhamnose reductase
VKVAVLGATGLLGRYVTAQLETDGLTVDRVTRATHNLSLYSSVKKLVGNHYDWIVNCAGIVKCRERESPIDTVLVNSALPHWLEYESRRHRTRLIQVSTDCVFSGSIGHYHEDSDPDPVDLYGASKVAGELHGSESLTLRCSFIGLEQGTSRGLLAWLLAEAKAGHAVKGYTNALWNGLSTHELARVISRIIAKPGFPLSSVYHVSGGTISKFDLLCVLRSTFGLNVEIAAEAMPMLDRTLNATRFRVATGYSPPTWNFMAQELAEEWRASK